MRVSRVLLRALAYSRMYMHTYVVDAYTCDHYTPTHIHIHIYIYLYERSYYAYPIAVQDAPFSHVPFLVLFSLFEPFVNGFAFVTSNHEQKYRS